mmetsp:Transcript_35595/g.57190  ORF Transcript_35595/g.57190 Transcript_35595/m.57190 type:complete len:230 (+) Transcript_35595:52-741(+)
MGVKKAIPLTKPAHQYVSIDRCVGERIGVDASVWLHEIAANPTLTETVVVKEDYGRLVAAFIARANKMVKLGIIPIFVFDGERAPQKNATSEARQKQRANRLASYEALSVSVGLHEGATERKEILAIMAAHLRAAISVTKAMVSNVIEALRHRALAYYIAPLEADGQLAWLCKCGLVRAVFTSDTDLIFLGCEFVYLKINWHDNTALLIERAALSKVPIGNLDTPPPHS